MLGLWGTSNLKRVAVSMELDTPKTVLGYIREIDEFKWVAEGDPGNQRFDTPREAAEHGYAILWRAEDPGTHPACGPSGVNQKCTARLRDRETSP
jgi:hypothetical protein